jgi:hypothetical protein
MKVVELGVQPLSIEPDKIKTKDGKTTPIPEYTVSDTAPAPPPGNDSAP